MKYVCFKDGVNLTEAVEAARKAAAVPTQFILPDGDGAEPWVVAVQCPVDQCQNVFTGSASGDGVPGSGDLVVVGRPPTNGEGYLIGAAKELAPDKSLGRANDAAKFVITNISLVALVAGGFGIFSDAKGGFEDNRLLYGLVVGAAVSALVFAVAALFPRTKDLNLNDLEAVRNGYASSIRNRARWAKAATAALVVALIAGGAIFVTQDESPTLATSAGWDASGTRLLLDATVKVSGVPDDGQAVVTIERPGAKTSERTLTTERVSVADSDNETTLTVKLPVGDPGGTYVIRSTVTWDLEGDRARQRREETTTVTAPPFSPPPPTASTDKAS